MYVFFNSSVMSSIITKESPVFATDSSFSINFIFSDSEQNILKETGWLVHNNSNDDKSYLSHDEFLVPFDLNKNSTYYIQYKVLTNNKMEVSSPKYRITQ